jgi:hypothetical protein
VSARPKNQPTLAGGLQSTAIDWKAMNARLLAGGVNGKAEETPDSTEIVGDPKKGLKKITKRPGFKEKFRVVSPTGKVLGLGFSPGDAVSAAIHLWGTR